MRTTINRALRVAVAGAAVLGVSLVAAPPALAAAPPVRIAPAAAELPDAVGAPQLALLESGYATGKVLQLADPDAQVSSAPGATQRAAAAIVTMKTADATALRAQALRFYPVTGSADTYVIADQSDRVLVRSANDSSTFRYLGLSTLAEAAGDPYAQWQAKPVADGSVNLVTVQRDASSGAAALDLYNWKTADHSEVQTYTLNTAGAAVQNWRIRPLTPTVDTASSAIEPGHAPALPTSLVAKYSWGLSFALTAIAWQQPDASVWQSEGTVTVPGTAKGFFGEDVAVARQYVVGALADAEDATMSSYAGVTVTELAMHAPKTVVRPVGTTGGTVTAPVTWDWSALTDAELAQAGTVTVPAAASTGFAASLVITLTPAKQVNLLREKGVHYDYTFKDDTTFALTDGNRNASGFADWRSGGATNRVNPNSVSFYFDQPRQVTGANVYDIAGKQNIGTVTVQYRTVLGGWKDLPGSQAWPYTNTATDLSLETTNDPVLATGVRVKITNKSTATWMSLSEVEVYGPQA